MNIIPKLISYGANWGDRDIVVFTANQVVKRNGELVMGAGNAKAARDSIEGSAMMFGKALKDNRFLTIPFSRKGGVTNLAALVTKQHFKDPSNLEFVIESLRKLYHWAVTHPSYTIHLPYPAIGFGGLTRTQLDPILKHMPNNVLVYINPKKY